MEGRSMELILHIGMGKTGTSALQKALKDSNADLRGQGVLYLGMWMHDPADPTAPTHQAFFGVDDTAWRERGKKIAALAEKAAGDGISKFVVSNESFFHHGPKFQAFIDGFGGPVKAVAYVRRPESWLPSAYLQWGVRHKTRTGPIPSFGEFARQIVHQYSELLFWQDAMGENLTIRPYDEIDNVVSDFYALCGIDLAAPKSRFYTRGEDAENVVRALFNNRFEGEVPPGRFNGVIGKMLDEVTPLDAAITETLDFSETPEIVEETRGIFEDFAAKTGVDLLAGPEQSAPGLDRDAVRDRIFDYVLRLSLEQSVRIRGLERRLEDLEGGGIKD